MKKALVCAHVASMIQQFNMENIRLLQQLGYTVDVVCNLEQPGGITPEKAREMQAQLTELGVGVYHMPAPKKVTAAGDIMQSFRIVRRLMQENRYDLVHCHSPIGGAICRMANRVSGNYKKTKIIYTAHGFHFYQGAPLINWLMYYPIEKICARWTDVLITINREDHQLAKARMSAGEALYVPGVGVDVEKLAAVCVSREEKLQQLGISPEDFVIFSVGELNSNKNHRVIIEAMAKMELANVHYMIAGRGADGAKLQELARSYGLEERVHVLGYRSDVPELMAAADVYAFPSYREGLPVSMMEAMAMGKAVVCSQIRGNVDLMEDKKGGFLLLPNDVDGFAAAIETILCDGKLRQQMSEYNKAVMNNFDRKTVEKTMAELYGAVPAKETSL